MHNVVRHDAAINVIRSLKASKQRCDFYVLNVASTELIFRVHVIV